LELKRKIGKFVAEFNPGHKCECGIKARDSILGSDAAPTLLPQNISKSEILRRVANEPGLIA